MSYPNIPVSTTNLANWIRQAAGAVNYLLKRDAMSLDIYQHALDVIRDQYGVKATYKSKNLIRFGRNENLSTTPQTVQIQGGMETYVSTNSIAYISSSSASDTQSVYVEGYTIDGSGNLTFVTQTVTLAGQTKTALPTPLARAVYLENKGSTDFAGDIYIYENDTVTSGVPATAAKIHLKSYAGDNQSDKCSTSVSSTDFWVITALTAGVLHKTTAYVNFALQIRNKGGVFVERFYIPGSDANNISRLNLNPPIIVPPNSDVRMIATASAGSVDGIAEIGGYLATTA